MQENMSNITIKTHDRITELFVSVDISSNMTPTVIYYVGHWKPKIEMVNEHFNARNFAEFQSKIL
jgi:hypothetical protein